MGYSWVAAQETAALPAAPQSVRSGWIGTPSSLVLYDSSGSVVQEMGLSPFNEDMDGGKVRRHSMQGGVSQDGHFAWTWEKIEIVSPGSAAKPVEVSRQMRYLGMDSFELWHDDLVDSPAGMPPAAISTTGEVVLIGERGSDGWVAAVVGYTGTRVMEVRGKKPVESLQMSAQGQFGLIYWHAMDQPPEYTWLDIQNKASRRIPIVDIIPVPFHLDDDGKVHSGSKIIFDPQKTDTKPK